jgi:hypothetical protein
MKKSTLIRFTLFLSVFIFFACKKEVIVTDCVKRHAESITVKVLPDGIDLFSNPDLRCDISPLISNYWAYVSNTVDNVSGLPITIFFPQPILFSEEDWSLRLVDIDAGTDDIIYESNFDPYMEVSQAGTMPFLLDNGETAFELNYTESE